jgi:cyclophilin family peptidyl-prolyl cis-trans isomerase
MKILKLLIVLTIFAALAGCNQNQTANNKSNSKPNVKTGVAPVADPEVAVIEMENDKAYGRIVIELYSNIAPEAVKRFKELAREGVYDGTTFHRVNPSVIQGGDPLSKDNNPQNDGTGKSNKPDVPAEFSDIPYDIGIVGAARSMDVNSANSQFFITRKREPAFDRNYTVFGKVIEGMNHVTTIGGAPRDGERPTEDVRIKTIKIQSR